MVSSRAISHLMTPWSRVIFSSAGDAQRLAARTQQDGGGPAVEDHLGEVVDEGSEPDREVRRPRGGSAVPHVDVGPPAAGQHEVDLHRGHHPGGRGPCLVDQRHAVGARPAERVGADRAALPEHGVGGAALLGGPAHRDAEGAVGRDHVLDGRADLEAVGGLELGGGDQRAEHRPDRGAVVEVDLGEPVDERLRRVVAHELHRELAGDPLRRRGVVGQVAQHPSAHAATVAVGVRRR